MKKYHVTFYDSETYLATGRNYDAISLHEAIEQFYNEFPDAVFLYIASEEMFKFKY